MKVAIDPKKCVRCGACDVLTQGAIVSPGDRPAHLNPKADLKDRQTLENIQAAVETCPQKAIKIEK